MFLFSVVNVDSDSDSDAAGGSKVAGTSNGRRSNHLPPPQHNFFGNKDLSYDSDVQVDVHGEAICEQGK